MDSRKTELVTSMALPSTPDKYLFCKQLLSGAGAAAFAKTVVAPVTRIQTILQVQSMVAEPAKRFKGTIDAMRGIVRDQTVFSLWRGNGVNVMRMVPGGAIRFAFYDRYKLWAMPLGEQRYSGFERFARRMAAGGLSGVTLVLATYPMLLAQTRLTADMSSSQHKRPYVGLKDCLQSTIQRNGFTSIFSGLPITIFAAACYLACSFPLYDTLKARLPYDTPLTKLVVGSVTGLVSQTLVYPLNTVTKHMQLNGEVSHVHYKNTWDCARTIMTKDGVRGFYRGCVANVLRSTPSAALQFMMYEVLLASMVRPAIPLEHGLGVER